MYKFDFSLPIISVSFSIYEYYTLSLSISNKVINLSLLPFLFLIPVSINSLLFVLSTPKFSISALASLSSYISETL